MSCRQISWQKNSSLGCHDTWYDSEAVWNRSLIISFTSPKNCNGSTVAPIVNLDTSRYECLISMRFVTHLRICAHARVYERVEAYFPLFNDLSYTSQAFPIVLGLSTGISGMNGIGSAQMGTGNGYERVGASHMASFNSLFGEVVRRPGRSRGDTSRIWIVLQFNDGMFVFLSVFISSNVDDYYYYCY